MLRLYILYTDLKTALNEPDETASETMSFATGYCVGYDETFAAGDGTGGAYVCQLTVAADKLELPCGASHT
jgi:hypothetical protein